MKSFKFPWILAGLVLVLLSYYSFHCLDFSNPPQRINPFDPINRISATTSSSSISTLPSNSSELTQTSGSSSSSSSLPSSLLLITLDPVTVDVNPNGCTVIWKTNLDMSSQVEISTDSGFSMGEGIAYPDTPSDTYTQDHSVEITGLSDNTDYFFMTISYTEDGELLQSDVYSFNTVEIQGVNDLAPIVIDIPSVHDITIDSARFEWTTDKQGSSEIVYSTTENFFDEDAPPSFGGTKEGLPGDTVYFHNVTVSGFSINTTYYYRVITVDAFGNVGFSDPFTFTTIDFGSLFGWIGSGGGCGTDCFNTTGGMGTADCSTNGFYTVRGIDVDTVGNFYITDEYWNRIQKFDSNATWIGKIGTYDINSDCNDLDGTIKDGWVQSDYATSAGDFSIGGLNHPHGLAINNTDGLFYVCDYQNHRVAQYSLNGVMNDAGSACWLGSDVSGWHCGTTLSAGSGDNQFTYPFDITYAPNEPTAALYITDNNNHRVKKYFTDGTYIGCIGGGTNDFTTSCGTSQGAADYYFQSPTGVAAGSDGSVYIVDTLNHRVQKWSSAGLFLGWIGQGFTNGWATGGILATGAGQQEGAFYYPRGIALDANDNLYIADVNNHRIQKWTKDGVYQGWLGKGHVNFTQGMDSVPQSGTGLGEFDKPYFLAYDSINNRLLVSEENNHRVQVFQF